MRRFEDGLRVEGHAHTEKRLGGARLGYVGGHRQVDGRQQRIARGKVEDFITQQDLLSALHRQPQSQAVKAGQGRGEETSAVQVESGDVRRVVAVTLSKFSHRRNQPVRVRRWRAI
ncbi:hypothetical protein D3C80_1289630 [compost metagenome]